MWDGDRVSVLLKDDRLRWPDTFAEVSDGAIYVPTSGIQDSALFKPNAAPNLSTQLRRFQPAGEATGSVRPANAALRQ